MVIARILSKIFLHRWLLLVEDAQLVGIDVKGQRPPNKQRKERKNEGSFYRSNHSLLWMVRMGYSL